MNTLMKWKEELVGMMLIIFGGVAMWMGVDLGNSWVAPIIMGFGAVTAVGPAYYNGLKIKRDGVEFVDPEGDGGADSHGNGPG